MELTALSSIVLKTLWNIGTRNLVSLEWAVRFFFFPRLFYQTFPGFYYSANYLAYVPPDIPTNVFTQAPRRSKVFHL